MQDNLIKSNMLDNTKQIESIASENFKRKRAMNEYYLDGADLAFAPPTKFLKRSVLCPHNADRPPSNSAYESVHSYSNIVSHDSFQCQQQSSQDQDHIEYVNVMFDGNLMPPVQNPPIIATAHSEHLTELTSWTTHDLLDLDQKATTYTMTVNRHEDRQNFEAQIVHFEFEKEPAETSSQRDIEYETQPHPSTRCLVNNLKRPPPYTTENQRKSCSSA